MGLDASMKWTNLRHGMAWLARCCKFPTLSLWRVEGPVKSWQSIKIVYRVDQHNHLTNCEREREGVLSAEFRYFIVTTRAL